MSAVNGPRRQLLGAALGAGALPSWAVSSTAAPAAAEGGRKVLRVLFKAAESSFDPARISDVYSRCVTAHIFEALFAYDHLAPDARLKPLTADGMPEVSADFKTWTIRVQRGIFFADDPAFKGQRRELQARDYLYALQRVVDPANISPIEADVQDLGILGLKEAREVAVKAKGRFNYDAPIEGLQLLDSHTLRIRLAQPRPRLLYWLADSSLMGGVAREVVQHYGEQIAEHPVGTGPFCLKSWRRSSKIVLQRNPTYRTVLFDGQPAPDDAEGQALLQRFKGRRLPMVDEVEVSIIDERQPQWLSFLNAQVDLLGGVTGDLPESFGPVAAPGGKLSPALAKRGVVMQRELSADSSYSYFNMLDATVGGYTADKVALRRAISLAYDVGEEIRQIRHGRAIIASSPIQPHTSGYVPTFRSEMADFDPARANALLDLYGYADRNGDGWREQPDGSPLLIEIATEPEQHNRAYNELWQKSLKRVGLQVRFKTQQWPENLKAAEAGKLMMWFLGGSAGSPDGVDGLARYYGPQAGNGNHARFKLEAFDRLYDQLQLLPDGPERERLFFEAKRLAVAYMPYKIHVHRYNANLLHPWVIGFRRPAFANEWWHTVDLDTAQRSRSIAP
ncbi:MAG: bicyclomycin resistance protein [Burkholderiales bacterium PBB5]|nr:MAG: bicyclomycin resistance protein [Burkholderiales bacterium PBB5]